MTLPLSERLIIRSRRVVTPDGVRPATVHVADGRVERIGSWEESVRSLDAGDDVVMPGLVDTHVHVNEPGRTHWEGFDTATRAAAAAGVTTILDMPLNSIPATTSVDALRAKRDAARGKMHVNVEFIGGVIPGNADQLEPLTAAGVRAFKCFLTPSGVDEFPAVLEKDLREAFPRLARTGLPLMVHAEDPSLLRAGPDGGSRVYADYLTSRPVASEQAAIEMLIRLMDQWSTPVHIVHLSSSHSLDLIGSAKARGLPLTVETCPHYLTFAANEIPDGATEYKCAPPIRDAAERDGLWRALAAGDIDMITSDHSPCPPDMKDPGGDFFAAWGGIASLQLTLSAAWTGARARGLPPEWIAGKMSAATARLAGLAHRKGQLAAGYDADIVIWNPDESFVVDPTALLHRHHVTPYAGREVFGRVRATYVGGRQVFRDAL